MARPKTLTMKEGDVTLNGFSPEVSKKIQSLLENFDSGVESEAPATFGELPFIGVGSYKVDGKNEYNLVEIAYNPETKEAKVVEVKRSGDSRLVANSAFKVACVKLKLI